MLNKASGSTFLEINPTEVKSIEIAIPNYAEQVVISKTLCEIDQFITMLEDMIAKKHGIKDGVKQRLLEK